MLMLMLMRMDAHVKRDARQWWIIQVHRVVGGGVEESGMETEDGKEFLRFKMYCRGHQGCEWAFVINGWDGPSVSLKVVLLLLLSSSSSSLAGVQTDKQLTRMLPARADHGLCPFLPAFFPFPPSL